MAEQETTKRSNHFKDISGQRFGSLTVISFCDTQSGPSGKSPKARWNCVCDCGNTRIVSGCHLRNGHTASCGCIQKAITIARSHIHGLHRSSAYLKWQAAKNRCFNKSDKSYHRYGGRGITMCPEWCDDFMAFFAHLGHCPAGLTLERINNNGNYEPGNVRWATPLEQARNKRNSIRIKHGDELLSLRELSERFGISVDLLWARYHHGRPLLAPNRQAK